MVFLELKSLRMGRNISNRGYENTAPILGGRFTCVLGAVDPEHVEEAVKVQPSYDYVLIERIR